MELSGITHVGVAPHDPEADISHAQTVKASNVTVIKLNLPHCSNHYLNCL